jgi:hypothetical protein
MTKNKKYVFKAVLAGILCATGALVWTGCDTASADEELVLSPSSVVLSAGQSQLFTVSGGYHYTWSISGSSTSTSTTSTAQGSLSSLTGSEVRYFAPPSGALSGKVTLTVTSTIPGSGSAATNSPEYSVTGHADITFK